MIQTCLPLFFLGGLFRFFNQEVNTPNCGRITHLIVDLLTKTTQLDRYCDRHRYCYRKE